MTQLDLCPRIPDSTLALARRGGWRGEARRVPGLPMYEVDPGALGELYRAAGLTGRKVPALAWEEEEDE